MKHGLNPTNRNRQKDLSDLIRLSKEMEKKCALSNFALHNEINKYVHSDSIAILVMERLKEYKEMLGSNPELNESLMIILYGEAFWMGARWREEQQSEGTTDKAFDL